MVLGIGLQRLRDGLCGSECFEGLGIELRSLGFKD